MLLLRLAGRGEGAAVEYETREQPQTNERVSNQTNWRGNHCTVAPNHFSCLGFARIARLARFLDAIKSGVLHLHRKDARHALRLGE